MEKELKLINKLYPWYHGLSMDLIFYIAINTLWLSTIKGLSPAEITFLSTISSLFGILFQIPSLKIMKKIGNTNTVRFGSLFMLIASILFTFGTHYLSFAIANIFLEMSLVFKMMSAILIKNNLEYQNKSDEFVKMRSKASTIYAISTAISTLFIGTLFNIHNYLPMILGIVICIICFILSFKIFDIDEKLNKDSKQEIKNKKLAFPKPLNLFLLLLFFYAISFGIIVLGQQNGKLLVQFELNKFFSINKVATYLGIILFISRMIRILTNSLYPKVHKKLENKMCLLMVLLLFISALLLVIGYYLDVNIYVKLTIMTLGFSVYPTLRSPIEIYSQNLILNTFEKKYHQDALVFLSFSRHIGKFSFSLLASWILLKFPLQYLFIAFIIFSLPLIFISKKIIKSSQNEKSLQAM